MNAEIPGTAQSEAPLKITASAVAQAKTLLAREGLEGYGLRVGVTGGGCSGFSYMLDFEHQEKPGDKVVEADGIKLYVDEGSFQHLRGTVIDYVTGLQGAGFKFINPNATGTCGCGTSFSA